MKRKLMAKYVPFLVSENEALGSFKKWRSGLISSPSGQQMTKTLMPFWFYKAAV